MNDENYWKNRFRQKGKDILAKDREFRRLGMQTNPRAEIAGAMVRAFKLGIEDSGRSMNLDLKVLKERFSEAARLVVQRDRDAKKEGMNSNFGGNITALLMRSYKEGTGMQSADAQEYKVAPEGEGLEIHQIPSGCRTAFWTLGTYLIGRSPQAKAKGVAFRVPTHPFRPIYGWKMQCLDEKTASNVAPIAGRWIVALEKVGLLHITTVDGHLCTGFSTLGLKTWYKFVASGKIFI